MEPNYEVIYNCPLPFTNTSKVVVVCEINDFRRFNGLRTWKQISKHFHISNENQLMTLLRDSGSFTEIVSETKIIAYVF